MSATQYTTAEPEPVVETSYTAIAALVIAIVAIILIVVIVWLVSSNLPTITETVSVWSVVDSGTTFDGSPNSIYRVPAATGTVTNVNVTISAYPNIASFVGSGRTTVFKIDNTNNATASVTLTGITPITTPPGKSLANPAVVPAGAVYEYQWVTTSTYKLIGWSVS